MQRTVAKLVSSGPDQTTFIGASLARALAPGDILALDGALGAGKTQLVRGIAEGLGLDPRGVSSPTFVIVCEHALDARGLPGRLVLIHADAYRLSGPDDLDSVGWDAAMEPVAAGLGVACIEWASRIAPALGPPDHLARMLIEHDGERSRRITLDAPVSWTVRPGWTAIAGLAEKPGSACPVCGRPVGTGSELAPFDSVRCRDADLGRWLTGAYAISREIRDTDEA